MKGNKMSEEKKSRWIKFGKVIKKKNGGTCIVVGDPEARNPAFQYNVEVTIKNGSGKKVAEFKNGFLQVTNPRKRAGITEEQASKIPDSLLSELFFVENNE